MKIATVAGRDVSNDLIDAWAAMHCKNAVLESPYFHPEFFRCVARSRPDTEVAVLEEAGEVVGFFPFERVSGSVGRPVGGVMSDYHGLVSSHDLDIDPSRLLRACNLTAWDFSHVPASQAIFHSGLHAALESPQIDLSGGYELYQKRLRILGSHLFENVGARERRLTREVGPVCFRAQETSDSVLDQILRWKSAQYARTGVPDIFGAQWRRSLLHDIHKTRMEGFAGMLSALYAGDHLIAAHFGMRSRRIWHYWFPAYDPAFQKFSPGLILLLKMAQSASSQGVEKIDLGAGDDHYKTRFMTDAVALSAGSIELPGWRSLRRGLSRKLATCLRSTPLEQPLRAMAQRFRTLDRI